MSGNGKDNGPREVIADSEHNIKDRLYGWCQSKDSVSSLLATNPDLTPADAWQKLFHYNSVGSAIQEHHRTTGSAPTTDEELQRARLCGKWGSKEPSDLFTRLYHDALCTLDDDPGRGMVSPCLMGSCGTVPLTIISVLPDIVRHMSNLIVRAEKEVFLATNFWQNSVASRYITNAIRELSRRAQARGTRIIMKIIYDRGNPRQVFDPHYIVSENDYVGNAIGLPPAKEIPGVDLQVMNYHQPVLGTFHAKYMIVDRRIGIIQSDNIQDNDNLEMMVQVEGPIVDSLYDMAMISWHKKLDPPLPCLHSPATGAADPVSFNANYANIFSAAGSINGHSVVVDPAKMPSREPYGVEAAAGNNGLASPANDSGFAEPSSASNTSETLLEHTTDDPHYDNDIAGEVFRVQAAVSAKPGETVMQAVTRHLNHTNSEGYPGNAPECNPADETTPYVPCPAHEPFPMALVNRAPYGRPSTKSVATPQNAAWLSALRNAKRNVFIQTPTLNAEPLIPAIVQACERGVDVYCYVCLGYNDAGEMLPMQGGHNDKIAHQLYTTLSPAGRQHLRWYWYVAKDQTRPIPAEKKKRSCHIKLMIVDEQVGIAGNGNQDTQSWFHSQEINVMIDSPQVCRAWIDALRRNQNTGIYGAVQQDGIWRDEDGKEVEGATGVDAGRFSWFNGVVGAYKRFQGTGGF
ncbi:phospholipase D/nuclease [Hypoxylon argillaceum]|nr:phospholipase D/nuclease [Hypoxylon argillaceum]